MLYKGKDQLWHTPIANTQNTLCDAVALSAIIYEFIVIETFLSLS